MPTVLRMWRVADFSRQLKRQLLAGAVTLGSYQSAAAADWYETAQSSCSGDAAIIAAFVALLPFSTIVRNGNGNLYVEANVSLFNQISASNGELVVDRLTLNSSTSTDYRAAISGIADSSRIPYFVDVSAAVFAGLAFSSISGTALGLVFTYLLNELKKPSSSISGFSAFIADGGELDRRLKTLVDPSNGLYLVTSLEYSVSLGNEARRFITAGCAYPSKVIVKQFRTNETFSNKIISPYNGNWGVFDIDDNKWDSTVLKYLMQDQEYYYFSEDAIENGTIVGQNTHRISFRGGRWQYKSFYDGPSGAFKNLSGPILAL